MHEFMQFLATLCCAIFTGASIYINAVEHPARIACGIEVALPEWDISYQRATLMQAPLAVLSFISSVVATFLGANNFILTAGILIGIVVPFTLIVMMPTNKRLQALNKGKRFDEAKPLLKRWNLFHMVRSALSSASLVIFLGHSIL